MLTFLARRLAIVVPTLVFVSMLIFSLQQLLQNLQKKAGATADSLERDSARRLLRILTMNATERTSDRDYLALLDKYKLFTTGR